MHKKFEFLTVHVIWDRHGHHTIGRVVSGNPDYVPPEPTPEERRTPELYFSKLGQDGWDLKCVSPYIKDNDPTVSMYHYLQDIHFSREVVAEDSHKLHL